MYDCRPGPTLTDSTVTMWQRLSHFLTPTRQRATSMSAPDTAVSTAVEPIPGPQHLLIDADDTLWESSSLVPVSHH
jgi:hypothetical protein